MLDGEKLAQPELIERSLRALQLAGDSIASGCVVDGLAFSYCKHDPLHFRVLDIEEVSAVHGGWIRIENCCAECPANLPALGDVGNCFGWLRSDEPGLEWLNCKGLLTSGSAIDGNDRLLQWRQSLIDGGFQITDPLWYGIWMLKCLSPEQSQLLATLFEEMQALELPSNGCAAGRDKDRDDREFKGDDNVLGKESASLRKFMQALRISSQHGMIIDICSLPSGYSDSLRWTIDDHCPSCKARMLPQAKACRICYRQGGPHPMIKRKVRGHRPFIELEQRFDPAEAVRIRSLIEAKAKTLE